MLEVELDRYASLVRGPGARELVVEVAGRPPMWVSLARGYSVSEKTARDVICAAEMRGYDIVMTGAPRARPEPDPVTIAMETPVVPAMETPVTADEVPLW